jgi:hypothetical protein
MKMRGSSDLDERWTRRFNTTQQRTLVKERAVAYLGGKCLCCGYNRSLAALGFHHRDPRQKDFEISSRMSWAAIEPELQKCVLLCSNCHAETHAGLHPQLLDEAVEDLADVWEAFSVGKG